MLLEIISPMNGTVVQVADIEVIVRAESGSEVRINGEGWTNVGDVGFCRLNATLSNGTTTLIVEGRDELGNNATDIIIVYLQSPRVQQSNLYALSWIAGVALLVAIAFSFVLYRRKPPNDV